MMDMKNKRIEMYFLVAVAAIAILTSIMVMVGFWTNSLQTIVESSRWLAFSVLLLSIRFGISIYNDLTDRVDEVQVVIQTREDIEEVRRQVEERLAECLKEIEEQEKNNE